jgi:hypothetical protein
MQVKVLIIMQFRTILGDDCHVVSCMGGYFFVYGLLYVGETLVAEFILTKEGFR